MNLRQQMENWTLSANTNKSWQSIESVIYKDISSTYVIDEIYGEYEDINQDRVHIRVSGDWLFVCAIINIVLNKNIQNDITRTYTA